MAQGRPEAPAALDAESDIETVRDVMRAHLPTMDGVLAPSTLAFYESAYRRGVDATLGHLALPDLSQARVVA
jgi:hypothetical protein